MTDGSALPDDLFHILQDPTTRDELREAIISRYFASTRPELIALIQQEKQIGEYKHPASARERMARSSAGLCGRS